MSQEFTAYDLKVPSRRRRQFMRGLVKSGRAERVLRSDGRGMCVLAKSGAHLAVYRWV